VRRYAETIIRWRFAVIALTAVATLLLGLQITQLRVIVDPARMLPQDHPYVSVTNRVEQLFGSKYVVVVGITPREGTALTPAVLEKVRRMTDAFLVAPGVVRSSVSSLAAPRSKGIVGTPDGMLVRPLMETVPRTPAEVEDLRRLLRANPVYADAVVSRDERTVAIFAEFKQDARGFGGILERVRPVADRERDGTVDIHVGGLPVFVAEVERYSQRMAFLFPLAVLITGLIHYEAFRTVQGLVLPLVTALLAVVWGLGVMRLAGVPMDVFNGTTPILILAVAAGHAVQILKRYYEEYHRLRETGVFAPKEANRAAVVESIARIGPVMLTAGSVAALGFLSLIVFEITTIRTFGVFTGLGILSALVLEMTFIPALRSLLPAPGEREGQRERERRLWDRITETLASWVIGPGRRRLYAAIAGLVVVCGIGVTRVVTDNSMRSYFFESLAFQQDDRALNARLGGTNTLYLLVEAAEDDAIKTPAVLQAMAATQRFLEQDPAIGKTISLADFVSRMNKAMHGDDVAFDVIPETRELISQYLLLYSLSGEPGDLDAYVDYQYRSANVWVFAKTDSSAGLEALTARLTPFVREQFGDRVRVRLGGSVAETTALNEVMVRAKILNIVQISAVILVIASLVFRSLLGGLLVLVPLLLAVLVNFGIMGLTGIRLSIGTSLISAMAVGIGADYAIYVIYRFREELSRSVDEATALRVTLTTAGKAILFVASAVAGGYGVLLFSFGYYIHMWFAILIASAMLVSSLSALTLLPALLMTLRPRFVFGRTQRTPGRVPGAVAVLAVVIGAGTVAAPLPLSSQPLTARDVVQRNFTVTRVLDSTADITFTLVSPSGGERVRRTLTRSKLRPNGVDNMRMVQFQAPPDVRGLAILTIEDTAGEDDIWVYIPALRKVRRLAASSKKDSYAGTDFSYGDIIGHRVDDWTHRLVREESRDEQPCYVIESIPVSDAVKARSGYAKRLWWIRRDNFVAIREELWDAEGRPLKVLRALDVQAVDLARGNWQAMRMEATNLQTNHRTLVRLENFKANQRLSDELFTTRYMEREL
jgi:predicted RND superfamily exporter protein